MGAALKKITVTEAQIKTATVEVKTLTLNGKQITLAVFRQLKKEPIIDPYTAKLCGEPWGIVNYFWGDCADSHLHIVWQKGEELRRACCFPLYLLEDWSYDFDDELGYAHTLISLLLSHTEKPKGEWGTTKLTFSLGTFPVKESARLLINSLARNKKLASPAAPDAAETTWDPENRARAQQELERLQAEARTLIAECWQQISYGEDPETPPSPEYVAERIHEITRRKRQYKIDYEALYEKLRELDQLFIAV